MKGFDIMGYPGYLPDIQENCRKKKSPGRKHSKGKIWSYGNPCLFHKEQRTLWLEVGKWERFRMRDEGENRNRSWMLSGAILRVSFYSNELSLWKVWRFTRERIKESGFTYIKVLYMLLCRVTKLNVRVQTIVFNIRHKIQMCWIELFILKIWLWCCCWEITFRHYIKFYLNICYVKIKALL